ncbi:MAG: endonuclease III [Leptospirales bacterium]|nr:endonuclease III [Leptospirales bacterium]
MNSKSSSKILSLLYSYYGETNPDLKFTNLYELTIAVVLSAQTTDKQVNGVTVELFGIYPDFESLSKADILDVEEVIKSTGFYKNKARNIISLSQMVCSRFNGNLPDDMESLMKLPGVGRKSANVILSIGFNKPGLAVDTHVLRISNRLGYSFSDSPLVVEKDLCRVIDPLEWKRTHLLFIRHGRELCKARNPKCGLCPVKRYCSISAQKYNF